MFKWVDGAKLIVKRGMTGATGNIYCGLHEFTEMCFLLHLLQPNDLFIDVGANIGSYTILASKICKAHTLAFEPDPETAKILKRNIAANDLDTLAEVYETAVGAYNGEVAFTVGLDTMNRIAAPEETAVQTVPIRRLDDIGVTTSPTFIKLDVEGFEEQVLAGASRILTSSSLLAIQSELSTPFIEDTLRTFGFQPVFYEPFSREIRSTSFGYRTWNTIFLREIEVVLERLSLAPLRNVAGRNL